MILLCLSISRSDRKGRSIEVAERFLHRALAGHSVRGRKLRCGASLLLALVLFLSAASWPFITVFPKRSTADPTTMMTTTISVKIASVKQVDGDPTAVRHTEAALGGGAGSFVEGRGPTTTISSVTAVCGNVSQQQPSMLERIIQQELDQSVYSYTSGDGRDNDAAGVGRAQQQQHLSPLTMCDVISVPFDPHRDSVCIEFASIVVKQIHAATDGTMMTSDPDSESKSKSSSRRHGPHHHQVDSARMQWKIDVGGHLATVTLAAVPPQFEQRTIKFQLTVNRRWKSSKSEQQREKGDDEERSETMKFLLKVPQADFPLEPFSEVAAFHVDRLLQINRVPPTLLVPFSITLLNSVAQQSPQLHMVKAFASGNLKFSEWVQKNFVDFVARTSHSSSYTKNVSHVYVALQLFITEVSPLLSSVFSVPYTKQNPGWHRWLNPAFHSIDGSNEKFSGSFAALLAISELAMYDYVIANNDRSPNKNNFVAGGCRASSSSCRLLSRRPSGVVPTFVHLDQGMAWYGTVLEHNPIGKRKSMANPKSTTFCLLYEPLVATLRCMDAQLNHSERAWEDLFEQVVPLPAAKVIGVSAIRKSGKRARQLLEVATRCLDAFGADVVFARSLDTMRSGLLHYS